MGAKQTTTRDRSSNLTREEIDYLCNLYQQVCKTKPERGCTYDDFISFCSILHPLLTNFLVHFYFENHYDIIIKSVKEFSSFYVFLVRGLIEDKAKVMEVLLLSINRDSTRELFLTGASAFRKFEALPINFDIDEETLKVKIQNYFRGLICSYIKLAYSVECEEFLSWRYVKSSFFPQDVDRLAMTLSEACPLPATSENFEQWVTGWKTTKYLHYVVYDHLFGLETLHLGAIKSLYPLCLVKNRDTVCILDMCSILHLNCYLPPKLRTRWKLLFSSSQHGVNYSHLMRRILFEGPTLVVIKDKNKYVFGGFASESWRPCSRFYGYCSSFLFQSQPKLKVYEASGRDDGFQFIHVKANPKGFGMGKGAFGDFAWWIEPERLRGSCGDDCTTFQGVPILSSSRSFKIEEFEVWSVEDSKLRHRREQILKYHTLAAVRRGQASDMNLADKAFLVHSGAPKYKDGYTSTWVDEKRKILEKEEEDEDGSYNYAAGDDSEEDEEEEGDDGEDGEWDETESISQRSRHSINFPDEKPDRELHPRFAV